MVEYVLNKLGESQAGLVGGDSPGLKRLAADPTWKPAASTTVNYGVRDDTDCSDFHKVTGHQEASCKFVICKSGFRTIQLTTAAMRLPETPPLEVDCKIAWHSRRPAFEELPLGDGDPKGSCWGLWGTEDEAGTLNLITPDVVAKAAREVRAGLVVPLNLPLDCPVLPMNPRRTPCSHNIIAKGYANDDEVHLNTQSSSHWDGLRHYPYQIKQSRRFYNGVSQDDISGECANSKIGIQVMARRGIVSRGVLLDWRTYAQKQGIQYSPFSSHAIPLHQLIEVVEEQNVSFLPGDIVVIRTGWTEEYNKLSRDEQTALAKREHRTSIGVEASEEMIKWHWDCQFAAVASDTNAYEAWPSSKPWGVSCHEVFLSGWGMPIGEVWDLEKLSETCKALNRWTFLLSSSPLNLNAGVASPANVLATF